LTSVGCVRLRETKAFFYFSLNLGVWKGREMVEGRATFLCETGGMFSEAALRHEMSKGIHFCFLPFISLLCYFLCLPRCLVLHRCNEALVGTLNYRGLGCFMPSHDRIHTHHASMFRDIWDQHQERHAVQRCREHFSASFTWPDTISNFFHISIGKRH
jgi:hypothetical protein